MFFILSSDVTIWRLVPISAGAFLPAFWAVISNQTRVLTPETTWKSAIKGTFLFSLVFTTTLFVAWVMIELSMWLAGKAIEHSTEVSAQIPSIAFASIGYPLIKAICIKALEPAWRGWIMRRIDIGSIAASRSEGETLIAVQKDTALTIAYDCFFGVAGRIVVLRQPTFVAFLLALIGSSGFEFAVRVWEAAGFRRKTVKAVWCAEEKGRKKEETEDDEGGHGDRLEKGLRDVDIGEDGDSGDSKSETVKSSPGFTPPSLLPASSDRHIAGILPKLHGKSQLSITHSRRSDSTDLGEQPSSAAPFRVRFTSLYASTGNVPSDESLAQIKPTTDGDSVFPIHKVSQGAPVLSSNVTTLSLMRKAWGAHQLAVMAADMMVRIQGFTIVATFISSASPARHSCYGYVSITDLSTRTVCSILSAILASAASLAIEERLTGVRYGEVMKWLPKIPWYAYGMAIMLAVSGGMGPMVSVDAGLFGKNDCLMTG
ncbi:hypothetical protein HK104_002275 [Borealophlyctis nickersoniae]|nr:hypothetical protein HK104_002275 [Borealophlyctis nickersoniae]